MLRLGINVLGISETRRPEEAGYMSDGCRIIHSGGEENHRGIAIILHKSTAWLCGNGLVWEWHVIRSKRINVYVIPNAKFLIWNYNSFQSFGTEITWYKSFLIDNPSWFVIIHRYYGHSLGHVTAGNGSIWLDNVRCRGTETDIASCTRNNWGSHDCGHDEDVSVRCGLDIRGIVYVTAFILL